MDRFREIKDLVGNISANAAGLREAFGGFKAHRHGRSPQRLFYSQTEMQRETEMLRCHATELNDLLLELTAGIVRNASPDDDPVFTKAPGINGAKT